MGHTNSTTYYNLPQFLTTDKPAWLTDINNAMLDIDTAVHAAQADATSAGSNASQALLDASAAASAASAADAKGAGACASIENAFDSTAVYSIGAKVMYNSLLYRCNVAVVTPGPWTGSANWERITVDSIIPSSSSDLTYVSSGPAGSVGAEIDTLKSYTVKSKLLEFSVSCRTSTGGTGLTAYRSSGAEAVTISSVAGYPTGKTIIGYSTEYAYLSGAGNMSLMCLTNIQSGVIYAGSYASGDVAVAVRIYYYD